MHGEPVFLINGKQVRYPGERNKPNIQRIIEPVIPTPKRKVITRQALLKGETPDPVNVPSGCCFHPRCPEAFARCKEEVPLYKEVQPGHYVACHLFDR